MLARPAIPRRNTPFPGEDRSAWLWTTGLGVALDRGEVALPAPPPFLILALEAGEASDPDGSALVDWMTADAPFAGRVLRLANSPAYQPQRPLVSMGEVAERLGLSVLRELALVVALQSAAFGPGVWRIEHDAAMRHALLAASWAREIARVRRLRQADAFLGGLFSGVGKLALLHLAHEACAQRDVLSAEAMAARLDALVTQLHVRAGLLLSRRWELPAPVPACIAFHQQPHEAGPFIKDAATAALADAFAGWSAGPFDALPTRLRQHPAVDLLNVSEDELESLSDRRTMIRRTVNSLTVAEN